jgi:purine nucleoside permease
VLALSVSHNLYSANAAFTNAPTGLAAIVADPMFIGASDYHLQAGSQALNSGTLSTVYATFLSRYGIDIAKDLEGRLRPIGAAWDRGAYEYDGSNPGNPVAPPINLRIIR